MPRGDPGFRSQRKNTNSPAARQEFRWTEEKKETLGPGAVTTSDRQMRTYGRMRDLWSGAGGGHGKMGYQTKLHLA